VIPWETIGSVCIASSAVAAVIYPLVGRRERRVDEHRQATMQTAIATAVTAAVQPINDKVEQMQLKLAAEFGGNSNGMRQAIDEQGRAINRHGEDIALIKGSLGIAEGRRTT